MGVFSQPPRLCKMMFQAIPRFQTDSIGRLLEIDDFIICIVHSKNET